tara:strand:+ start:3961 stop:4587 length:627 start_codon:yes stop_codon:yes gene_type:complete
MEIKIFDNFLKEEDFKEIESLYLPLPKSDEIKIFNSKIFENSIFSSEFLSKKSLQRFNDNYHQKAIDLLKELCPEKIKLYSYSEFHLILTGKNYKFPIHDDTPNKLLSGVIYINPEINNGTKFYVSKTDMDGKEIKWKKNRAVFFSRKERETWHSYEGDRINTRVALVYNLMTNDIKSVCKIEKKNYLLSLLRFKLNPYIYRLFKKLI